MMFKFIVCLITFLAVFSMHAKHALHVFQQNRYSFERYTKWLMRLRNYHLNGYFVYIAACYLCMAGLEYFDVANSEAAVIAISLVYGVKMIFDEDKKEYIKPLVYTHRVIRQIVVLSLLIILVLVFLLVNEFDLLIVAVLVPILAWILIYPMAFITLPLENMIKKSYENEARSIIDGYQELKKIGITGSFGKTSTKNIVENIISSSYYTLMTPKSYNTPMGITRTIREYLKPIHEVFICEMGAVKSGDIAYLMDFVKPQYGIVTSIGPQHLNTFHSLENIIKEKMQMIEKLPANGVGIINIDNEYIRNYQIKNNCTIYTVGIKNASADYVAFDIDYNIEGSTFKVRHNDEVLPYKTRLLGEHNIMNILTGIALAKCMGIDDKTIQKAVAQIKMVEHRLELKSMRGYTIIDNAFNSNPVGCLMSLEVLSKMPNEHVVITPGLIDLGKEEYRYNRDFGAYMKGKADWVLLVGKNQTKAIVDGLNESGFDMGKVKVFANVREAFNFLYSQINRGATVLLENDLPDAFSN